jgi:hypothetical protein
VKHFRGDAILFDALGVTFQLPLNGVAEKVPLSFGGLEDSTSQYPLELRLHFVIGA